MVMLQSEVAPAVSGHANGHGMMFGRSDRRFSINGDAFDMERINFRVSRGSVERWTVSANMMMHPFHIHGVNFQVLSENGRAPKPHNTGWKDTVLINGSADLLIRFDQPAQADAPFMYTATSSSTRTAG